MTEPMAPPKKVVITSPAHRHVAVDTFGLRVNDNLAQIIMSLETIDAAGSEVVVNEVTSVMTLRSLKVLTLLLTGVLERIEKDIGPVSLPQSKVDELLGKVNSST